MAWLTRVATELADPPPLGNAREADWLGSLKWIGPGRSCSRAVASQAEPEANNSLRPPVRAETGRTEGPGQRQGRTLVRAHVSPPFSCRRQFGWTAYFLKSVLTFVLLVLAAHQADAVQPWHRRPGSASRGYHKSYIPGGHSPFRKPLGYRYRWSSKVASEAMVTSDGRFGSGHR